ncbi:MAG: DUF3782 domain-containing protein [Leptolyngbya sp.]|nr:DUF3782 domain-containing protein [Leptolyngbya sp.]
MTDADFKAQLKQQLPDLLRQDDEIRGLVLHTVEQYFANRQETESRFDQVLAELRRDREAQMLKWQEQSRKWEENDRKWEEHHRKWDETLARMDRKWEDQNRKWEENGRRQDEILADIKAMNLKHESTIGALGARWGLYSEAAFRNGLKAILEGTFGVQVLNVVEYDDAGEVFGRPEQIELDLIIRNGDLILCEIKSSVSKPDLYAFLRKVEFYEKRHQRQATRKMVISPMVHPSAQPIGPRLGIEVYSYAEDVPATPTL